MADVLTAPLQVESVDGRNLVVHCSGDWMVGRGMPSVRQFLAREIDGRLALLPAVERVTVHGARLGRWDSSLVSFVAGLEGYCQSNHVAFDKGDLPPGVRRLVDLALAVPEKTGTRRAAAPRSLLITVGEATLLSRKRFLDGLGFLGEATLSLLRLVAGQARFRRSDLLQTVQECGVQALGIAFIISLLVGLILAFVGAVQLRSFGAEI